MRGSIYLKTLCDLQGQMLAWSAGMIFIGVVNVLFFPTIQSFPGIVSFLENMPPAIKAMVGDVEAMVQLEGFLRAKVFDVLPILLSIFVISQGSGLIAGEIETKSFDLLLARPISRWRVLLGKFLALLTATVAMVIALTLSLIFSAHFIEAEIASSYLFISCLASLPLTWLFGALALLGSCWLPRARQAAMAAGGLVVVSYIFETLRMVSTTLRHLDEISLFALQKAGWTLAGEFHATPVLVLLGLMLLIAGCAVVVLNRKDLAS